MTEELLIMTAREYCFEVTEKRPISADDILFMPEDIISAGHRHTYHCRWPRGASRRQLLLCYSNAAYVGLFRCHAI